MKNSNSFTVNSLFQNNMVLQRNKPIRIWGTGTSRHKINIKISWMADVLTVTVRNRKWIVIIPTASTTTTNQNILIYNENKKVALENILIGDVWICSGQSNMVMPLSKLSDDFGGFHGVENFESEIQAANYPGIRILTVSPASSKTVTEDLITYCTWKICNSDNARYLSAVTYYFARKIFLETNVPVGLIISAVNNSRCEEWTSISALNQDVPINNYYANRGNLSGYFNAMIHPLRKMSISGFIWYQGESNLCDQPAGNYTQLMKYMILDWRTLFKHGKLAFYFVQLPPYNKYYYRHQNSGPEEPYELALFREAQAVVRDTTGNTGMVVTMDLDKIWDIHSSQKKKIGERLALYALNRIIK